MNQTIKFELTVQEANLMLQALGNMPYIQVAEFIAKLKQSADAQVAQSQQPEAAT